jgi:hypothetical protein
MSARNDPAVQACAPGAPADALAARERARAPVPVRATLRCRRDVARASRARIPIGSPGRSAVLDGQRSHCRPSR